MHLVWNDLDIQEFVDNYFPQFSKVFSHLPLPVLRADVFRYMVLTVFGGIYSDIDTRCLRPIDKWTDNNKDINLIVGIESDVGDRKDWKDWYARELQWCQWTIAAIPRHPVVMNALFTSMGRLYGSEGLGATSNVMEITGPGVWTDAVNFYLESLGSSWKTFKALEKAKVIGDSYFLTITGFSPGVGHMGSKSTLSEEANVEHLFKGSWKEKEQK
ncbi:membrane-bound alpha-1,6- mannosyltransferase Initiation-specific [Nowakowskiella sp. JEL0078]|nr:membrane-bound alpha-1,6- mannosyltransferase Initiation-specific [Nowakowskiella sp. JEL0078]